MKRRSPSPRSILSPLTLVGLSLLIIYIANIAQVHSFFVAQRQPQFTKISNDALRIRHRTITTSSTKQNLAKESYNNPGRGLLEILNDEVSELILDRLSKKLNGNNNDDDRNKQPTKDENNNNRQQQKRTTATAGLSKFHRSIVASTTRRQRCVTGKHPLQIKVVENPTRKWLLSTSGGGGNSGSRRTDRNNNQSSTQMLVNGTIVDRSLASFDRFQWLDEEERVALNEEHALVSLELLAEIHVRKPGYVNILPASAAGSFAGRRRDQIGRKEWTSRWNHGQEDNDEDFEDDGDVNPQYNGLYNGMVNNINTKLGVREEDGHERMWVTGFSITKQSGEVSYVDVESGDMGNVNSRTASAIKWPNEVCLVPKQQYYDDDVIEKQDSIDSNEKQIEEIKERYNTHTEQLEDSLLVSDGFLVPGRDNGGLYIVMRPGDTKTEWRVCLTGGSGVDGQINKLETAKDRHDDVQSIDEDGWFYHRSIWIDLTGDGRKSILTARAKRPSLLKSSNTKGNTVSSDDEHASTNLQNKAQLVWLERPKPHSYDKSTGTPLDADGLVFDPYSPKHTPWRVRVLDEGPDVMFSVADLDTTDDTIEIIASQFFNKQLTLHSLRTGPEPKVVFRRVLDDRCGASFSSIFANLDGDDESIVGNPSRAVVDSGSTVETLKPGETFSHVLVTSHECTFAEEEKETKSSFNLANLIKDDKEDGDDSETEMTTTSVVTSQSQPIDGGSLFSYRIPSGKDAWKTEPWTRSIMATGFRVRGQLGNMINPGAPGFCYTFYPKKDETSSRPLIAIAGDCAESAYILRPVHSDEGEDPSTNYTLMCEIECGATVGSIGIGYEDFCFAPQQSGYAKLYIPCYEKDKVLVFAMGNGEDDDL